MLHSVVCDPTCTPAFHPPVTLSSPEGPYRLSPKSQFPIVPQGLHGARLSQSLFVTFRSHSQPSAIICLGGKVAVGIISYERKLILWLPVADTHP